MEIANLQKIDGMKMYEFYDKWPKLAELSYKKEFTVTKFPEVDHIIFAGMGGSGSIGDIMSSILSKKSIHVIK